MIYLGLRRLVAREECHPTADVERRSLRRIFSQGVVVAVLNPKAALFFLAFLPQFVDPSRSSAPMQFLALGSLFVLMAIVTDGLYALLAGTAGQWLNGARSFWRGERLVVGSVYIGLGLTAAFSGADHK